MPRTGSQVLETSKGFQAIAEAKPVKIAITKLKLDPNNARLRYLGKLREEELERALLKEPGIEDLYKQIEAEGGITEPLYVDSKYIVREGNERLVCLRKLSREAHEGKLEGFPKDQFDMIPCRMIPSGSPESEIAIWLARIHVKGKNPWRAWNKALIVYELSTKYKFSYEEIRKRIGISKKTVQTTISAYDATLEYKSEHPHDADWYYKYSYYYEIFKNEQLRKWIRQNDNSELFGDWIHTKKLPRGEDVRKLKELIDSPKMIAEFNSASVTKAKDLLRSLETGGSKSLRVLAKATEALRKFPVGELRTIASDPIRWKIIEDLHEELKSFIRSTQSMKES